MLFVNKRIVGTAFSVKCLSLVICITIESEFMKKITTLFFLLFLTVCGAQPGTLDLSFNPFDIGLNSGANNSVSAIVLQSDGKVIVGGNFTTYNGVAINRIIRLNTDGTIDSGFNVGTGANNTVSAIAVQPDGKIIIGGNFTNYNGVAKNRIARLNSDGSLDVSFTGTGANNLVAAIVLQSDGKIIIGGNFTTYNGTAKARIVRLNSNGALDTSFVTGTGANALVSAIVVQPDGKILTGGSFTTYNGSTVNRLARLNTDGSVDAGFILGTGASDYILTIVLQSDNKIVIGGNFVTYNGVTANKITRLNADGTLDTGFNSGTGANNVVRSMIMQSDGRIVVGGSFTSYNGVVQNRIIRLNNDGTLDSGFNSGTGLNNLVAAIALQSNNEIIIGGSFTTCNAVSRNRLARLNTDGSLDFTFITDKGANNTVRSVIQQPDGKILIGGVFTLYNGIARSGIARLNADGTIDNSFNPGIGIGGNTIFSMALQPDGKIVIAGNFTTYNGIVANRIARVNPDGSLDTGFITGTGANNIVSSVLLQTDGKILIGGSFTNYNGSAKNRIIRLDSNGALDTSFNIGAGANNVVQTMALQSDGKILIGGAFTSYKGILINRIARINADGSFDTNFTVGTGANNTLNTIVLQADGKIMIGGNFTTFNGNTVNRIARLISNGSLDTVFNASGAGANNTVCSIAIQPDGKMIVGGQFTTFNTAAKSQIVELNTDGTINANFIQGTGPNSIVYSVVLQLDYKILIGGNFTGYNGVGRNRIARLNEDSTLSNAEFEKSVLSFYPNPATTDVTFSNEDSIDFIQLYNINGQEIINVKPKTALYKLDVSNLSAGIYYAHVFVGKNIIPVKIIKK